MNIGHRRAQSEISFRFSDDISHLFFDDDGVAASSASMEGEEEYFHHCRDHDDILATYMDMEKICSDHKIDASSENCVDFMDHNNNNNNNNSSRIRHSFSVDGFSGFSSSNNNDNNNNHYNNNDNHSNNNNNNVRKNRDFNGEAKKAMSPDKLAELWVADPKRAKRILANRQSAARSKERKARYIVELEKKVQALQTEATALSAQLSLFERDTGGLTSENTELRRQLESTEQQAQLRDALNDALQQELDRLKVATGETTTSADAFIMPAVHNIPCNSRQTTTQQQGTTPDASKSKLLPLYPFESTKMPSLHSFDFINISCAPPAHNTSMTNLQTPYQTIDLPKVKSQQQFSQESSNLLGLPHQSQPHNKGSQLYPLDTNLYLPVEASKQGTMPQFCTIDTNQHCPSQHNSSPLGHLPQFPVESNSQSPEHEVYVTAQSPMLGEMTSQDHLSRFQGLDLSGRGSHHLVKVEGPSIIASESMGF